jgi:sugar phosphate isomerase/epimerase
VPRPVTLFTGQWADLPLDELAGKARQWGYDGLELACRGDHFDVPRALSEPDYVESMVRALNRIGYHGPRSVEWEDAGMDREAGAAEAVHHVATLNFPASDVAFDAAFSEGS